MVSHWSHLKKKATNMLAILKDFGRVNINIKTYGQNICTPDNRIWFSIMKDLKIPLYHNVHF